MPRLRLKPSLILAIGSQLAERIVSFLLLSRASLLYSQSLDIRLHTDLIRIGSQATPKFFL